jgi:WXG100 family type VII secretion target
VPNVNVTYTEMQAAARQLQAGEQTIQGDLSRLRRLVDNLVAGGYVTDASSRQFEASYAQFSTGATEMIQGLTRMAQYLDEAVKAFGETDAQFAASLRH